MDRPDYSGLVTHLEKLIASGTLGEIADMGFIIINRGLMSSDLYRHPRALIVLLHLCLRSSHRVESVQIGRQAVQLQPGEILCSRHQLVKEIQMTDGEIRGAVKYLKETGWIDSRSNQQYTVFTIKEFQEVNTTKNPIGQRFNQRVNQRVEILEDERVGYQPGVERPEEFSIPYQRYEGSGRDGVDSGFGEGRDGGKVERSAPDPAPLSNLEQIKAQMGRSRGKI